MDKDKILKSMTNVKPNEKQIKKIEMIRELYKNIVIELDKQVYDSRELSLGVANLENSLMWVVKSIVLEDGKNESK